MTSAASRDELTNRRILVVEDDHLLAEAIAEVLAEAGAEIVGPVGWADEAMAIVMRELEGLDAVLLDINLHGTKTYPIAERLRQLGKGFVFITGYGEEMLDSAYRDCPRCEKPVRQATLVEAVRQVCKTSARADI